MLNTSFKYVFIFTFSTYTYLHRGATAIAQVEHKYITVQAHSQAYDANELWHFPRQIIIPSRSRGCDYHSSDPTETSRIRRVGLLLPVRGVVSLKMLTCSGATLPLRVLACWRALPPHFFTGFSAVSSHSVVRYNRSTFVHSHTEHRRCALKRIEISDKD